MNNNQRIWVNVTTIYHWNRPAVGIIRVESEFVRYLLDSGLNDHYFIYDHNNNEYLEVTKQSVRESLKRQNQQQVTVDGTTIAKKSISSSIKSFLKQVHLLLPSPYDESFWSFFQVMRKLYRDFYLIPRYYFKLFIRRQVLDRLHKLNQHRTKFEGHPARFRKTDWVISMGLNWDYLYGDRLGEFDIKRKYGAKIAFVCYDLIPIKYPHLCLFEVANKFSKYFVDVAWIADHVFCISKNTMNDLKEYLKEVGGPVPSMSVIRLGDNLPKERAIKKEQASLSVQEVLTNKPYILFVSTIERRKNHEVLYKAYRRLLEKGIDNLPQLVFVGMPGWGVNDLMQDLSNDPLIQSKILLLSHVNDDELDLLLKNCLFTVYPSLYEGWGLPVSESLAYGKFCLASNTSSLPEVGGDLIEYLDPWDVKGWENKLKLLFTSKSLLSKKNAEIQENYQPNNWTNMGYEITSILIPKKK